MKNYPGTTFPSNLLLLSLVFLIGACQNQQQDKDTAVETTPQITETKPSAPSLPDLPSEEIAATLEPFGFADCTPLMEEDSGCSCDFRPGKDDYSSSLFVSNIEETACVKINGSIETLSGGRIDYRSKLNQQSFQEHWIILKEDGTCLIFGENARLGQGFYKRNREILIQTLLTMDEMPKEIPLQFVGTTGMGTRAEIREMAQEALEIATKARAEGNMGIPMEMLYKNDQYDILITGYVDGKNDSGGDTYAGTIELKSKNGKILDSKKIWGDCNC